MSRHEHAAARQRPGPAHGEPARSAEPAPDDLTLTRFVAPRYWPTWLLLGALRVAATLPFRAQLAIGRTLGRLFAATMRRRRRIAAVNLAVCFPELGRTARSRLLSRHFQSVGLSVVEMGIGWFSPVERLRSLIRVDGLEHLERARAEGRGIILLSAHLTPLEVGFSILEDVWPGISCMYRPQRNAMMDTLIRRGRSRFAGEQIPRDNVRALVRAVKAGRTVAYIPDQTHVGNQSALLPFFGEPALTNVAVSKLAQLGNARVLPYLFRRLPGHEGYSVRILPPLEGVPSGDAARDARAWGRVLEAHIRDAPDQYLWLYKKFKSRPPPLPDLYADV